MNPYMLLRRSEKADKLVAVLREQKITAENLREIGDDPAFWEVAARAAGCKPPSVVTQRMVLDELQKQEAW